ncbi:hypothetical protein SAY86_016710 [Trapa natans]|uniref:Uncharacterized protein n=1 Tax=Trapa natans TaxID=22666 RepID=A0AAN7L7E6_TRANT|nr:hypothetical protein SAY86_016710 [Trapa natans]
MGITRTSREKQTKLTTGRIKRISLWGRSSRDRDSSSLLDRRIPTKGRIISSFCKKQRKDPCGVNNALALVWNLDSFGFGSGKKGRNVHRNQSVKSELSGNDTPDAFNPKHSGFGLAKFGPVGLKSHVSTRVMGTRGYCAPEYALSGILTKSDIYSFGVRETRHFFSKKRECSSAAAAPPDGSGYWKFLGKQPCHRYEKPIQVGQNKLKAHFPFECIGERRWQSLS